MATQHGKRVVSFAILTANEREELAVNAFLQLGCVINAAKYPDASRCQYGSDPFLRKVNAKVALLEDAGYTHRLFSIEVNGMKQVGVHVNCDKMGPWGAFDKTVELLKTAKKEGWDLRYIFLVGCCGASVKAAKKSHFPRGTILLAQQVKDYLNTGKVEEKCEEEVADEMASGEDLEFDINGSEVSYPMDIQLLSALGKVWKTDTQGAYNEIAVKKVSYLSGPLVIKSSLFGVKFRDPSVDGCGVEMEVVGVIKAVKAFHEISGDREVKVVLAKGISDYTGRKGESGDCLFFGEKIAQADDHALQVNATVQSIALVIRLVADKMEWLFKNER